MTTQPIEVAPYSTEWPEEFRVLGQRLRSALGDVVARIDHIGSTAVPGLAAKPILDVQISIRTLEPADAYRAPLEALGFVFRADNPDRSKRYFRETPGTRRTHIHVRRLGSWGEQRALLFRDYLRAHPAEATRYERLKRDLAGRHRENRLAYTEAKAAFLWGVMERADRWSRETGWRPGPSDA